MTGLTFYILIFLTSYVIILPTTVKADCRRNSLQNLRLSQDAILSWDPVPNEDCTISYYLVYIKSGSDNEEVYTTETSPMDVSFLPVCENTRFVVIPVSPDAIQGSVVHMFADMPVPADVNLTIPAIRLTHTYEGIMLQWELDEQFRKCAKQYRVLIYDEASDVAVDRYVTVPVARIDDLVPCAPYTFGVTALYNVAEEGPVSLIRFTADAAKMPAPSVSSVNLGSTTVDLTWHLQDVTENRCPVSSLTIDASPSFKAVYPVTDQNNRYSFSTRLTNLEADSLYVLRVTANNTAGLTNPVVVAVQTLENSS